MTDQYYTTFSQRRAAQLLMLGATVIEVKELENLAGNIAKVAREWHRLGKEGPIIEFALAGVTPDIKKRVREMKYGRELLTDEEVKRNRDTLRRIAATRAGTDADASRAAAAIDKLSDRGIVRAAFNKVHAEIFAIEEECRQLRSRMATSKRL